MRRLPDVLVTATCVVATAKRVGVRRGVRFRNCALVRDYLLQNRGFAKCVSQVPFRVRFRLSATCGFADVGRPGTCDRRGAISQNLDFAAGRGREVGYAASKLQAPSSKLQAPSSKLQAPCSYAATLPRRHAATPPSHRHSAIPRRRHRGAPQNRTATHYRYQTPLYPKYSGMQILIQVVLTHFRENQWSGCPEYAHRQTSTAHQTVHQD